MTFSPPSLSTSVIAGSVESLWRYPVKSMRGEELQEVFAGFAGVYGDRLYAFRSAASPPGFPYLTAREQEEMLLYSPAYRYPERMARPVNLPEAEAMGSGLTPVYGDSADRELEVQTPAGEKLGIDDPRLIGMLRTRISPLHELTLLRSDRAMTDCRPISIISLQTVHQLGQELGVELDQRRFRANVFINLGSGTAFGENEFVGRRLRMGAKAIVMVLQRDTRCKMITLDPDTGKANPDIMRLLARDHESKAGVYGAVLAEGIVRPGDEIALLN